LRRLRRYAGDLRRFAGERSLRVPKKPIFVGNHQEHHRDKGGGDHRRERKPHGSLRSHDKLRLLITNRPDLDVVE
jgi:hypothetical protein